MNKKEISQIKKEFKEETYKLKINDVFSAYGKVDSKEILFSNVRGFFDFEQKRKTQSSSIIFDLGEVSFTTHV